MINLPSRHTVIAALMMTGAIHASGQAIADSLSVDTPITQHTDSHNPYHITRDKKSNTGALLYHDDIHTKIAITFSHDGIIHYDKVSYQVTKETVLGSIDLYIYDMWRNQKNKQVGIKAGIGIHKKRTLIQAKDLAHIVNHIIQGNPTISVGNDGIELQLIEKNNR